MSSTSLCLVGVLHRVIREPMSFSEFHHHPHLLHEVFLLLVKNKGEQITTGLMQTSKQILQQEAHKEDGQKPEPKVTRIIVSSPAVVQRGRYLSQRCHETCEQRVWLFLDIFSTPAPRVHWVGISNFITCHKRDTGCSGEHCSLLPPPQSPPLSTRETSHPSLEVVLGKRRRRFPQWEAAAAGQPTSILSSGA